MAPLDNSSRVRVRSLWSVFAVGLVTLSMIGAVIVGPVSTAQATTGTTEKVVQVVTRAPYGKMLATVTGLSLYITSHSCTGGCLTVWPPLVLAAGKTTPTGALGLGTATLKVGTKTELQVTFKGHRLYRFESDRGTSVNGNGVGGFTVAKVG